MVGGGALPAAWRRGRVAQTREDSARRLLCGRYSPENLPALLPRERWRPFPPAAERGAWEALPADVREAFVAMGQRQLGAEWPALPARLFLEYARTGNRSHYERVRGARRESLRALVAAECAEGKGRFVDEILNGLWVTCEETYWGLPAHLGLQKAGPGLPDVAEPTVDLFAAETSSLLAWTLYLHGPALDRISPLVRERIHREVDRRVLTPNLEREDFGWMGFTGRKVNNWNPWICSNWLASALLLERDERRRRASIYKILRTLDNFLDSYPDDGGCDEGPGYWSRAGGSLFDCLELLHSSTADGIDLYQVPLIGEIGRYIYRVHIHDSWFINFADASAKPGVAGDLVFRYGRRIGDDRMAAFGAWAEARRSGPAPVSDSIGRQLPALFDLAAVRSAPRAQPLLRDVWLPGIQVMAARRQAGSAEGLYLAAQGGHNGESHNHNDVGNFIVFADGRPVIIDIGVETYTAKTFSSQRYEIWTMQSAWHNLPTINGVMQAAGRQFAASEVVYRSRDDVSELALNLAHAYPPEAGVESWKRTLRLDRRKNAIELVDSYALKKPPRDLTLTLMTPWKAEQSEPGKLAFAPVNAAVLYEPGRLEPSIEEVPLKDERLRSVWGERLYRVRFHARSSPGQGDWTVRFVQGQSTAA